MSLLWRRDGGRLSPERIRPALGAGRAQPDYQKAVPEKGRRRSSGESVPLQGVQKDRDRLLNEKSENGSLFGSVLWMTGCFFMQEV